MGKPIQIEHFMESAWRAEQMLGYELGNSRTELEATIQLLRLANQRRNAAEAKNELDRAQKIIEQHLDLVNEFVTDFGTEQTEYERLCKQ